MSLKDKTRRKEYHKKYYESHKSIIQDRSRKRYYNNKSSSHYLTSHKARNHKYILTTYDMTVSKYNELYDSQNGCCAICGKHQVELVKALAVDHCHKTNIVRGLLCSRCNLFLGLVHDDVSILSKACDYLNGHKNICESRQQS